MLAKIKAVTLGEVFEWLARGLLWAIAMMLVSYAVGIEWSWRIMLLCIAAGAFDWLIYPPRRI